MAWGERLGCSQSTEYGRVSLLIFTNQMTDDTLTANAQRFLSSLMQAAAVVRLFRDPTVSETGSWLEMANR